MRAVTAHTWELVVRLCKDWRQQDRCAKEPAAAAGSVCGEVEVEALGDGSDESSTDHANAGDGRVRGVRGNQQYCVACAAVQNTDKVCWHSMAA